MLDRLERAFEAIIEGSIARTFRLRVQPAEIGRQLERAMLDHRATSVGATLAPNDYEVRIHPEDAAAFLEWSDALCREMERWLAEVAYSRGVATVGSIRVRLAEDEAVRRRSVLVAAHFEMNTSESKRSRKGPARVLFLISSGDESPARYSVTTRVRVGRAEENDLIVTDPRVSRRHALIEPDGLGWLVVDLNSTNGTWVNGVRVQRSPLRAGDDLAFGGVRFSVAGE